MLTQLQQKLKVNMTISRIEDGIQQQLELTGLKTLRQILTRYTLVRHLGLLKQVGCHVFNLNFIVESFLLQVVCSLKLCELGVQVLHLFSV
jgi:hypothetical protein